MLKKLQNKKFLFALAIINFIAGIYGLTYYGWKLDTTNPLFWIFVIDCPLYAIIFGALLLTKIKEKNLSLLGTIAIFGSIKFSLWTLFVFFLTVNPLNYLHLVIGHIFLLIEIIIFYKYFTFDKKLVGIAVIWFLINDFFDYVVGTHPFFYAQYFTIILIFSVFLTIVIPFFLYFVFFKRK